ncbi:hypothetical protein NPIL_540301 [Nephila pilipes]|uniref:Uncharacterized protein n=1 Tax=Nephila pilipes TaxID=299642 RepID=A0A8X6TBI1_NEPPI|nr:hypothetical protein NPIL_540301 [Nephila pilipes]
MGPIIFIQKLLYLSSNATSHETLHFRSNIFSHPTLLSNPWRPNRSPHSKSLSQPKHLSWDISSVTQPEFCSSIRDRKRPNLPDQCISSTHPELWLSLSINLSS